MKIQFINTMPLSLISGGNIYNAELIKGLTNQGFKIDYNSKPKQNNYDITFIDSYCMANIDLKKLDITKPIIAFIHLIPNLNTKLLHFYKQHATFIVTGQPTKLELLQLWHIEASKVKVIRPGIPKHWQVKTKNNNTVNTIVINANFIERKRHELLLPILYDLNNPTINISIIGNNTLEPNYFKFIQNVIKQSNIKNKIDFYYNIAQNDVYKKLLNADLFLSFSRYETFGMAIFEALAVGLNCLAFETGDVDYFKQFPNYYGIPNHDIVKFSSTLKQLCTNNTIHQIAAKNNLRRTWTNVVNDIKTYIN